VQVLDLEQRRAALRRAFGQSFHPGI
jgi:hypothetical protein